jgi:hypothetical protein
MRYLFVFILALIFLGILNASDNNSLSVITWIAF